MKKKIFLLLSMLLAVLVLTACKAGGDNAGGAGDVGGPGGAAGAGAAPSDGMDGGADIAPGNSEGAAYEKFTDMTSVELSKVMGNGINLGNTMEAYGRTNFGTNAPVSSYETFWGQPVTTQEMITGMKEAGFDTLRIPVAWTNMMPFESGDYTIDPAYLDRVEEIMNYAFAEDMFVIVNDHWDGSWWGMYGSATQETREKAQELYISMWTQIAERYEKYGDRLIFESANEELGYRLNDTDVAKDSGALSDAECFTVTNQINQTFVDTVRALGGNNADRFLLIAGFGTDINNTVDSRYQMPKDTVDGKLFISVHYYDPSGYCIMDSVDRWGYKAEYEYMNDQLAKMKKFTDAGYGVIIGEYGALPVNGAPKQNALEYTVNFLDNCDLYGYVPVLWDTNNGNYDKEAKLIRNSKMRALYQERCYAKEAEQGDAYLAQVQSRMADAVANAEEGYTLDEDVCMAWIMYNSADWSVSYSVGDKYDPNSKTGGIVATDVEITGAGTYTVGLDFTGINGGYADSTVFSALAIGNGETLYPDYIINIKEIKVNGEVYDMVGQQYTSSDDGICTRVNLYNQWVSEVPEDVRVPGGAANPSPVIVDPNTLGHIRTLEITFDYGPAQ